MENEAWKCGRTRDFSEKRARIEAKSPGICPFSAYPRVDSLGFNKARKTPFDENLAFSKSVSRRK
jgi:hypothetical protein